MTDAQIDAVLDGSDAVRSVLEAELAGEPGLRRLVTEPRMMTMGPPEDEDEDEPDDEPDDEGGCVRAPRAEMLDRKISRVRLRDLVVWAAPAPVPRPEAAAPVRPLRAPSPSPLLVQ